ncbi:MAG: multiprotein bridging factor aMBF1 [Desulfurococcales archaeon]|nr:multiprotein bridging factor aMBF1 [Desulfurococcales archaeon]MCE4605359.1 multiprotein bridging factor aMBF1 [Desulfurococcales archaeon]
MIGSSQRETLYCEVCGSEIRGPAYRAEVDGVEMTLCPSCYYKLSKSGRARLVRRRSERRRMQRPRRPKIEMYDIVGDYDERIKSAREAKGWSTAVLAQKLRISESMLKKIESGKMKPTIDLARRMEKLLGIELLVPTEFDDEDYTAPPPGGLTLGDIVVVRRDED